MAARIGLVVRISSWVNRIKWEVELRRAISVILGGVKRSVGIIKYDIVVMENVMLIMMTRAGGSQAQNSSRPPHLLFCLHLSDPGSAPHRHHLHCLENARGTSFSTFHQQKLTLLGGMPFKDVQPPTLPCLRNYTFQGHFKLYAQRSQDTVNNKLTLIVVLLWTH